MSKIDKDFGELIRSSLKKTGYTSYQVADRITGKKGRPLSAQYFSQLLSGYSWYIDYAQQALKVVDITIILDGETLRVISKEEIKKLNDNIQLAKELQSVFEKHNIKEEQEDRHVHKKKNR